jgi:hypothetical protein
MSDDTERSVASAGSQPVAWGNEDDDGIYAVGPTEAHAHYVWERAASGKFRHRNPRIVPLYRQPTLTDEEREAIERLCDAVTDYAADDRKTNGEMFAADDERAVAIVRGWLARLT